ncbi:hypothetical protein, partial [Acetobacter oeni]|uniref:hypothetical protein n=1 Tax=Acetobacter oeni TaxID=304077 RepID=UPI001C99ABCF
HRVLMRLQRQNRDSYPARGCYALCSICNLRGDAKVFFFWKKKKKDFYYQESTLRAQTGS